MCWWVLNYGRAVLLTVSGKTQVAQDQKNMIHKNNFQYEFTIELCASIVLGAVAPLLVALE